jgi:hypothetical protein
MPTVQKAWMTPVRYQTRDIDVFKKYCQDIQDNLDIAMTRTADTGQVTISSMVAPTWSASPTSMGYLIYRFNDALQATKPIFMKIEFIVLRWSYLANSSVTYQNEGGFQTKFTFGTGSDGAGNITNPSSLFYSPVSSSFTGTSEAVPRAADRMGVNYLTYNAEQGFLFFVYGSNATYRVGTGNNSEGYNLAMFSIQRTIDEYGQNDGRGFVVFGRNDGYEASESSDYLPARIQTYIYASNTWTAQERTNYLSQSPGELSSTYWNLNDGKLVVFPLKYWDPDYGIKDHPNIFYIPTQLDYPGANLTIESIPNRPRKFRSLGAFSMWKPTGLAWGSYNCLVLWE